MPAYEIENRQGRTMGTFWGRTPREALVAMHQDAGVAAEYDAATDTIRWPDAVTTNLAGDVDVWRITEWSADFCDLHLDRIRYGNCVVERGAYYGTTDDRADRWYIDWTPDSPMIDRRGPGYATVQEAIDAIDMERWQSHVSPAAYAYSQDAASATGMYDRE